MSSDHADEVHLLCRNLDCLPPPGRWGSRVKILDVSENNIHDLTGLELFPKLHTLTIDSNQLTSNAFIPRHESLEVLCVNKNQISNLAAWVEKLVQAFPRLRYLSMLHNPACPNFLNGGTPKQYRDYRLYVVSRLRGLLQLDSTTVTLDERTDAERIYGSLGAAAAAALAAPLPSHANSATLLTPPPSAPAPAAASSARRSVAAPDSSATPSSGTGTSYSASDTSSSSALPAATAVSTSSMPALFAEAAGAIAGALLPPVEALDALASPPPPPPPVTLTDEEGDSDWSDDELLPPPPPPPRTASRSPPPPPPPPPPPRSS